MDLLLHAIGRHLSPIIFTKYIAKFNDIEPHLERETF